MRKKRDAIREVIKNRKRIGNKLSKGNKACSKTIPSIADTRQRIEEKRTSYIDGIIFVVSSLTTRQKEIKEREREIKSYIAHDLWMMHAITTETRWIDLRSIDQSNRTYKRCAWTSWFD